MSFKYETVVPWGRNLDEYKRMFNLSNKDLKSSILGCGDGPASFNFELRKQGGNIVSIDPIYSFSKSEIQKRIDETYDDVISQTKQNQDKFKWNTIKTVEELGKIRMVAMSLFLNSFEEGKFNKCYVPGKLPVLPFADDEFDISLCSHFLFLYSDNLTYEFHLASIREMLRVSREVRVFPLLDVNGKESPYLKRIIAELDQFNLEVKYVNYEFQIGGNEVLIASKS